MLSKPEYGWSTVTIADFQTHASNMHDMPFTWLRACINGLKYNMPASFFIEEEGSSCIIVSYDYATHIIIEDRDCNCTLKTIEDLTLIDFAKMLVRDIKEYFEDWVKWYVFEDRETDYVRRRIELRKLIDEAERYLSAV